MLCRMVHSVKRKIKKAWGLKVVSDEGQGGA